MKKNVLVPLGKSAKMKIEELLLVKVYPFNIKLKGTGICPIMYGEDSTVMCLNIGIQAINFLFVPNVKLIIFRCPKIWAHSSLIIMCSNVGTPKIINFPFGANGKLMFLDVPIFKHFKVPAFSNLRCTCLLSKCKVYNLSFFIFLGASLQRQSVTTQALLASQPLSVLVPGNEYLVNL